MRDAPPRQAGPAYSIPPARGGLLFLLCALLLAAGCVAVFWPATNNDFVAFDDDVNIYFNPHLGSFDANTIRWAFTDASYISRYMPVGWLAFSTVVRFWGLDPVGFHLASILLHAVNAVLVFVILIQLGHRLWPGSPEGSHRVVIAALVAASWWAFHPMRSEVIAWATCLIYGVGLLFVLAAFSLYLRADRAPLRTWRRFAQVAMAGILYTLAVLTYPAAVGSFATVVAYDAHRACSEGDTWRKRAGQFFLRLREKLLWWIVPGVGLAIYSLIVTHLPAGSIPAQVQMSGFARLLRAPLVWAHHLVKPWWPTGLTPCDDRLIAIAPTDPWLLGSVLLCVTISALATWRLVRGRPGLLALWLAYVGVLLPLSGITEHVYPS